MDLKLELDDIIYIRKEAGIYDREEYVYYPSYIYDIKNDIVYSKYRTNNLKFEIKKENIFILNGRYYANKYSQFMWRK